MNFRISILVLAAACVQAASAQMFTEVTEYGWGRGMNLSRPACADPDQDGLLDLIVGEDRGHLMHFRQASAGSTVFQLLTSEFSGIDVEYNSAPSFTDLEGDGLLDLVVGNAYGKLRRYEQDAARSMNFIPAAGFEGVDVGDNSMPCFTDLDHDGLLDMLVGETNGNINRYEQDAPGQAGFTLVQDTLSGIDVGLRAAPCVADIDGDGLLDLLCGENSGKIIHYEQKITGSDEFELIASDVGRVTGLATRTNPCIVDFQGDGLLDLVIGEDAGNLHHCVQTGQLANTFSLVTNNLIGSYDMCKYSAPAVCDLDKNGRLDLFVGNQDKLLTRLEQEDSKSERFAWITDKLHPVIQWKLNYISPCFVDLDKDGWLDLIVGVGTGVLLHYEQDPSNPASFVKVSDNFNGINVGGGGDSSPAFTDLDGDGLLDLVVGCEEGDLHHYEQDAPGSETFSLRSDSLAGIDIGGWSSPSFTDLDGNGLVDMVVGRAGTMYHYEQTAVHSSDFSLVSDNFSGIGIVSVAKPVFADINRDGREDFLFGSEHGGIRYFRRNRETAIMEHPHPVAPRFDLFPNYPNPFNPVTSIRFSVAEPCRVELKVFDVRGREVAELVNGKAAVGEHIVRFDASSLPSGIFLYRIRAGDFTAVGKMAVMK